MQGQIKVIQGWACYEDTSKPRDSRWTGKCFYEGKEHIINAGSVITLKNKIEKYNNTLYESRHLRRICCADRALA